mmetsp:Transcript_22616/g.44055  ORF Transcript_22616/g.44055 Transcript_22616/m.44055 type:complete len:189 (-) Transcript_22616:125-691(-)
MGLRLCLPRDTVNDVLDTSDCRVTDSSSCRKNLRFEDAQVEEPEIPMSRNHTTADTKPTDLSREVDSTFDEVQAEEFGVLPKTSNGQDKEKFEEAEKTLTDDTGRTAFLKEEHCENDAEKPAKTPTMRAVNASDLGWENPETFQHECRTGKSRVATKTMPPPKTKHLKHKKIVNVQARMINQPRRQNN